MASEIRTMLENVSIKLEKVLLEVDEVRDRVTRLEEQQKGTAKTWSKLWDILKILLACAGSAALAYLFARR